MYKSHRSMRYAYAILGSMKGGKKAQGFTIMETLIVLAVTSTLFVIIAATLSGRQQRTQFEQAANDIRAQIQQVINDVGTGFYPSTNNFSCSAGAFGPVIAPGSTTQGENTGCIFLGKAMQFKVGTDASAYNIFPIAGLQRTTAGLEVATYAEARPKALSPSVSDSSVPDVVEKKKLQYGLTTYSMTYGASNTPIGMFAIVNSLATYSSGTLVSSSQQLNIVPVSGSGLNASQATAAESINTNLASSPTNPAGGIKICFASAGSNQSGLVTIGPTSAGQLSVTLSIKANTSCV